MANPDSRVTIHMAASLDGFFGRTDGSDDWLETSDHFAGGDVNARLRPAFRSIWFAGGAKGTMINRPRSPQRRGLLPFVLAHVVERLAPARWRSH